MLSNCIDNYTNELRTAATTRTWEFWNGIGCPKLLLSPLVDQSELAFRLLVRQYGAQLAYTPMLHARLFCETEEYRQRHFQSCVSDRPLIAQFCGNDSMIISSAAKYLVNDVDAIDINFGCPQAIAKRGTYGAYLINDIDLVAGIVSGVCTGQSLPVTCKLRKPSTSIDDTVRLCRRIEDAGGSVICLHGRVKEQKGQNVGECDWEVIRAVKQSINIPVIANGGIENYSDIERCINITGADAVMIAEAALERPTIFINGGNSISEPTMALEYIKICRRYPPKDMSIIKSHLFKILHAGLIDNHSLCNQLIQSRTFDDFEEIVRISIAGLNEPSVERYKRGWYYRHRRLKADKICRDNFRASSESPRLHDDNQDENNCLGLREMFA